MFKHYEIGPYVYSKTLSYYEQIDHEKYKRELIRYDSDKETLQGYYYPKEGSTDLVVFTHGYHSMANAFIPLITSLVDNNYSVFAYDCSGVNNSSGKTTYGFLQELIDLDYTLNYLKNSNSIEYNDIFLVGHSVGGFASCAILSLHDEIKGVVSISGLNNAFDLIYEKASQFVGPVIGSLVKPVINTHQRRLFKDYCNYTAVEGINKSNIPVLLAQGLTDKTILPDKHAITRYQDSITNSNVSYYFVDGKQGGHNDILLSKNAIEYQEEIDRNFKQLEKDYKKNKDFDKVIEFFENIDSNLYSEFNPELLTKIVNFLDAI